MRLINLRLKNFKGIRSFDLDAQGRNVSVYGENATGKTTLADAFMWLLFDKDSSNRKDFQIKTLDPKTGEPIHGLDHEVEAVLELDNGKHITLRKVFREKWTKKRGSAQAEFTGHTTEYFVDGVPSKKSEYTARVADIAPEDIFRLVTDPMYFNEHLHWQKRREILLQVCGDVSDAEVIQSNSDLAGLPQILGDRTLDDHRKVVQAERTRINKELEKIPVRIDEVTQGLPALPDFDRQVLEKQLSDLWAKRQRLTEERTRVEAGGEIAEKRRRLAEIKSEMLDLERQARAGVDERIRTERDALRKVNEAVDDVTREIRGYDREIEGSRVAAEAIEKKLPGLRKEWETVNAETLKYEMTETCPTCGQDLPVEQVEAAREKALTDFNREKARKLEEITAEGKRLRAEAEALRAQIPGFEAQKADAEQRLGSLQDEAAKIEERIKTLSSQQDTTEFPPEFADLAAEHDKIEAEIATLRAGNTEALERITGQIETLDQEITVLQGRLAAIDQHERGQARIQELKAEERRLAAEYERLEGELYLTEQFIRTKVQLLEDRINSKFELARFRLFNTLVNGGVEETCETMYRGVPYSSLNRGARMNVGLDIIRTLSKHYGFNAPIWIDNAEAVTRLVRMDSQVIRLVVSADDKELRVEHESSETQERMVV